MEYNFHLHRKIDGMFVGETSGNDERQAVYRLLSVFYLGSLPEQSEILFEQTSDSTFDVKFRDQHFELRATAIFT